MPGTSESTPVKRNKLKLLFPLRNQSDNNNLISLSPLLDDKTHNFEGMVDYIKEKFKIKSKFFGSMTRSSLRSNNKQNFTTPNRGSGGKKNPIKRIKSQRSLFRLSASPFIVKNLDDLKEMCLSPSNPLSSFASPNNKENNFPFSPRGKFSSEKLRIPGKDCTSFDEISEKENIPEFFEKKFKVYGSSKGDLIKMKGSPCFKALNNREPTENNEPSASCSVKRPLSDLKNVLLGEQFKAESNSPRKRVKLFD